MEILQIVGIGLIAAVLSITLKQEKPEMALFIGIAAGTLILLLLIGEIREIVIFIQRIAARSNVDFMYLSTILKVIGIAYIAEFGSQICKDAGENAIASKIELGGKLIILILTIPILTALIEVITDILP
jgi:stage III sporulation protein AD